MKSEHLLTAQDVQSYIRAQTQLQRLIQHGNSFSGRERNCAFLNTGGSETPSFANISAVSGFDFPDDGRGMATTDWDFDGDLDFWICNRTGPRLRFLRNDIQTDNRFAFVHLTGNGTSCNRDAIGARLELDVGDTTLVRTLKAGEGYLSQSSKWIHFGLGQSAEIGELRIRWPDGAKQSFSRLTANHYFKISQGDESPQVWTPPDRELAFAPGAIQPRPETGTSRIVLPAGVPLPRLKYTSFSGQEQIISGRRKQPLLLNLWASWCAPCRAELNQFQQHDVNVVALSVDGLTSEGATTKEDARKAFAGGGFTFPGGFASEDLLRLLQTYHDAMLEDHQQMPVPTSMLIDREGSVAVIYKGAIDPEVLMSDIKQLTNAPAAFRENAQPFRGQWLTPPSEASPLNFIERLLVEYMLDEAVAYINEFVTRPDPALPNALVQLVQRARELGRYDLLEQVDMLARTKLGMQIPPEMMLVPHDDE